LQYIIYSYSYINGLCIGDLRLSREIGNEISKSRIEALTDGIFAIVMTLLVLEVAVPQLTHSEAAAGELTIQLLELWPVILKAS
jgi:TMEM175 potassium channel family protein